MVCESIGLRQITQALTRLVFGVCLGFVLASCSGAPSEHDEEASLKIVGGSVPKGDTPTARSTVALVSQENGSLRTVCSGVLVAPQLVLTAAHCVESGKTKLSVFFGLADNDPKGSTVEIERTLTYKKDGSRFFPNFDIAWVRMKGRAPATHQPVEILRTSETLKGLEGKMDNIVLAGFGRTASSCFGIGCMGKLLEVRTVLKHFFNEAHFVNLLVIGPKQNHGTCNGDSGGPAFVQREGKWLLAGILNGKSPLLNTPNLWQTGVCESGEAIYNFAGSYIDWIESTSGVSLSFDAVRNPEAGPLAPLANVENLGLAPSLESLLSFNNHNETIWETVESLVNEFKDPARRFGATVEELVTRPELAAEKMRRWTEFTHLGLSFDFVTGTQKSNQISDVRPIGELIALKSLTLDGNKITDTYPLMQLEQLESLALRNNYDHKRKQKVYWDLTFIAWLPKLKHLDLSNNADNLPLYGIAWDRLKNLESLELSDNARGLDLSAIPWEKLPNLKTLTIRNSQLSRITALSKATSLEKLDLSRNAIESITALSTLENLVTLDLSMNRIRDFSPINRLRNLKTVKALSNIQNTESCPVNAHCVYSPATFPSFESYCRFAFALSTEDLTHWSGGATVMRLIQIAGAPAMGVDGCKNAEKKLASLTSLDLSGSPTMPKIEDLSPLGPLKQIEELKLANNDLRDLRPLAQLTNLKTLDLSMNYIENLDALANLKKLELLDLDGNQVKTLNALGGIFGLEVFVRNNPISSNECPIEQGYCHFDDPTSGPGL